MANSIKAKEKHPLLPRWVWISAIVAFVIMAVFGLVASDNPDGLEKTVEEVGAEGAESGLISFGETFSSDLLTMAVGMIAVFVVLVAIQLALKRFKPST